MPTSTCHPFLHQKQPSRESLFCGKVNDWRTKRTLKMLNFAPKTRQNRLGRVRAKRKRRRKAGRFTTTITSGCWACSSQPTATAACKCRRNRALADGFQLVENTLKAFRQTVFWGATSFYHREMEQIFQTLLHLCLVLCACTGYSSCFCRTKKVNISQSSETLNANQPSGRLSNVSCCLHRSLYVFCLLVGILQGLFALRSTQRFQEKTSNMHNNTQSLHRR